MAIDLDKLLALRIDAPHTYAPKDLMLYALGLGVGQDPISKSQLAFVYEKDLKVLPTFGSVMGYPGFWAKERPEFGITWQKLLNGEQGIELHRSLPTSGTVVGTTTIERVIDKGEGKGSIVYTRREVKDKSGNLICTIRNAAVLRGDGGFGGPTGTADPPSQVPDRAEDLVFDWPVLPQAALIYRLSGDFNPLHADPDVARGVGFERPILHGAATWGMAGFALLEALCKGDPDRFKSFRARFTSPALPGEAQRTLIWRTGAGRAAFRVVVPARNAVVLDNGEFVYQA
jgi:acyl dehydratase